MTYRQPEQEENDHVCRPVDPELVPGVPLKFAIGAIWQCECGRTYQIRQMRDGEPRSVPLTAKEHGWRQSHTTFAWTLVVAALISYGICLITGFAWAITNDQEMAKMALLSAAAAIILMVTGGLYVLLSRSEWERRRHE